MLALASLIFAAVAATSDTTLILGVVHRDLTGDGKAEILTLTGVGRTVDSLDVSLTIESGRSVVYRYSLWPVTRKIGVSRDQGGRSATEHRAWLSWYGRWFFGETKFKSPDAFKRDWGEWARARLEAVAEVIARDGGFGDDTTRGAAIWTEIQRNQVTIFEFSPGGDTIVAIGWSESDRRFYRLVECC
jgi:hypothetical protein